MFTPLKINLILVGAIFFGFASLSMADHIESPNFSQTLQVLNQNAKVLTTEVMYEKGINVTVFSKDEIEQISKVAKSQAEIWSDTILEGPYEADGQTEVDRVEALKLDGKVIALRVLYSERGWDISTCSFNSASSLDQCEEGRIQEASLLSIDLCSWTRDPAQFPVFLQK